MNDVDDLRALLVEIRDDQRTSIQRQEEHLAIAREQIERSKGQVQESLELQRQAMSRMRKISLVAFPGIVLCIVLIVYLVVRYL